MCKGKSKRLTAAEVLQKYTDEKIPEFLRRPVEDVNQVGMTGNRPVHIACIRGELDDLIALIEGGADVSATGDLGNTPLHIAASRGHLNIVKVLLRNQAIVNTKNEFGQTPIDLARLKSNEEVAKLLESDGKIRS
jgi:uncharacterized protein